MIWNLKSRPVFQSSGAQLYVIIKSGRFSESHDAFYGWKMKVYFVSGKIYKNIADNLLEINRFAKSLCTVHTHLYNVELLLTLRADILCLYNHVGTVCFRTKISLVNRFRNTNASAR